MTTIILCGGAGTRLWPASRAAMPKQFAPLLPCGTLFEEAVRRNRPGRFIIASNAAQAALAEAQLAGLGVPKTDYKLVVEPAARNTAPAIALAALACEPGETLLVVPSDHVIRGVKEYRAAIERAAALAATGRLVTFGIKPAYAEIGYGYIETAGERVLSFKEKPDRATAERYLASGNYLWNSGMFCFTAGTFISELERHAPELLAAARAAYERAPSKSPLAPSKDEMLAIPSISVDYAVMEKSDRVACVPCPAALGWSDLGSYDALYDELRGQSFKDEGQSSKKSDAYLDDEGNAALGPLAPVLAKARGNLVLSSGRRVVLAGVDDLVVVETADAVLVTRRGATQMVKDAVEALKRVDPEAL